MSTWLENQMNDYDVRMNDHCVFSCQRLFIKKDGLVLWIMLLMSMFTAFMGCSCDCILINTHQVTAQWLTMSYLAAL